MYTKGPTVNVSTSKGLRRSLRETGVVIGKRDDESEFQRRGEGAERWVLITSQKLDFGLQKKAKAVVGQGDTIWSVFPEIFYDLCSCTQLFASFLKTHSCLFILAFVCRYDHLLCQSLSSQTGHCETTYLSPILFGPVSSIPLYCFWSINNLVLHGPAVFYDPCPLFPIVPI